MIYQQKHMKKKITSIVAQSLLLAGVIISGLMYVNSYSNSYHLQTASAIKDKNTIISTSSSSSTTKTIQLSAKEVKPGVYNWIDANNGASDPTLRASANTVILIKIQNPTDTKHELIIDTGAYHPFTMKGTIQIISSGGNKP